MTDQIPTLTAIEARVLGCLMEKQHTTPDVYPLTLNALLQACNQKTSRHPVMHLELGQVGHTVSGLRERGLIHGTLSGRAERFDHKMGATYRLSRPEQAAMCVLMLRGPQTPGELCTNAARLTELVDADAAEALLNALAGREPPLVVRLPRGPGQRETRYAHLLCGEAAVPTTEQIAEHRPASASGSGERLAALEAEIAALRGELDTLWALTGLADQRPPR